VIAAKFRALYGRDPEFVARAPGRIEFIGNHTDYNGGAVLGASIDRAVEVALARRTDGARRFASEGKGAPVELPPGPPEKRTGRRPGSTIPSESWLRCKPQGCASPGALTTWRSRTCRWVPG